MGRPRKLLSQQQGNLTKEQKIEKEYQENLIKTGNEQLDIPPSFLVDEIARKEFIRIVQELKINKIEAIGNLDLNNLAFYCNSYSLYIKALNEVNENGMTIEYTNKCGATNITENPYFKIMLKCSDEIKKYGGLLGLTVDSKLKIANTQSINDTEEIIDGFGDI